MTNTNDRDTLSKKDIEIEIGLSCDQERVMMSDDIIQCLHSVVDCWEEMAVRIKDEVRTTVLSNVCHYIITHQLILLPHPLGTVE